MRAKTVEEVRTEFLECVHVIANYWARAQNKTDQEMCEGVAFSILVLLDGESAGFPATSIAVQPHEDDKEYYKSQGDNWYEPGMVFNCCYLHDLFHKRVNQ